jgi:hypothetical protein
MQFSSGCKAASELYLKGSSFGGRLAPKLRDEPEEKGQYDTDEDRCGDGEIESGAFAAVENVAGKSAEAEREPVGVREEHADGGDDQAEKNEHAAEVAEGRHGRSVVEGSVEVKEAKEIEEVKESKLPPG